MKNKWILTGIGLLLSVNLLLHLVFMFNEFGDARKIRTLEAELASYQAAVHKESSRLESRLEALQRNGDEQEQRLLEVAAQLRQLRTLPRDAKQPKPDRY